MLLFLIPAHFVLVKENPSAKSTRCILVLVKKIGESAIFFLFSTDRGIHPAFICKKDNKGPILLIYYREIVATGLVTRDLVSTGQNCQYFKGTAQQGLFHEWPTG